MQVQELIDQLQGAPPAAEVRLADVLYEFNEPLRRVRCDAPDSSVIWLECEVSGARARGHRGATRP